MFTTTCRDINELNILVKTMLGLALADIIQQGVNPLVVETYRSQERQNYLYCQGRTVAECTAKGIKKDFATKYCNPRTNKVTWTLSSIHRDRKAVDVVPQRKVGGKMTAIWNTKDKQTQIIIKTMQKYGFEAGANWAKTPDSPHFQIKADFTSAFSRNKTTREITKMIQDKVGAKIDGSWGADTDKAVESFQKANNLKVDKLVGIATLTAMFKDRVPVINKPVIQGEHIVQKGDTLSKIAYNNSTTVDKLVVLNGIKNPNVINVGQVIKLAAAVTREIKKGDMVKVKEGASTYEGKSVARFVYNGIYTVDEIKGDRVVLDRKGIHTAFRIKDLMLT